MPNTSSPTSATGPAGTLHHLAGRIAAYRALDLLLFEVIGSWITNATAAPLRPYYAAWSQHHGWHADLWAGRFPVVPDLDVHDATAEAGRRIEPVATALRAADSDTERVHLLAGHLLPQLAAALGQHRDEIVAELDAPTARVLDLVIDDLRRDIAMARQLLARDTDHRDRPAPLDLSALFG